MGAWRAKTFASPFSAPRIHFMAMRTCVRHTDLRELHATNSGDRCCVFQLMSHLRFRNDPPSVCTGIPSQSNPLLLEGLLALKHWCTKLDNLLALLAKTRFVRLHLVFPAGLLRYLKKKKKKMLSGAQREGVWSKQASVGFLFGGRTCLCLGQHGSAYLLISPGWKKQMYLGRFLIKYNST